MKSSVKILSVILILASIFGLVGGGIGLADTLECKDYWENKSEVSTADLNTLEDGLNTLAENKQAYIDGLAAYEQGSKDYDDGQKTLEDGKKEYEEGQKTLEEKEKEYNAGLAKLEDAEYKLSQARKTLEDNKQAYLAGKAQLAAYESVYPTAKAFVESDTGAGKAAYDAVNAITGGSSEESVVTAAASQVATGLITAQVLASIPADAKTQAIGQYCAANGNIDPSSLTAEQTQTILTTAFSTQINSALSANLSTQTANVASAYNAYYLVGAYEAGQAGVAEYEAGLDAYNKGLEAYYAGRETLLNGRGQLMEGKEKLEEAGKTINEGQKALNDAEQQLADGKAKLDEYESGQAQVIDGIETVLASETYGDLVSIADRLGPDFKYLDSNGILDIDQGLAVVAAAREFSGDNGTVVTRELTLRAVGAVLAIIAGVVALVAGAIGLIGSSKIAGIIAAAAAVVAVVAAILTPVAGTVMSAVAGSTVAAIVIAAAAVVAIVAIVNAVVDLATKKTTV